MKNSTVRKQSTHTARSTDKRRQERTLSALTNADHSLSLSLSLVRSLVHAFSPPLLFYFFFLGKQLALSETYSLTKQNAKDIIACGFDVNKTFIFSDLEVRRKKNKTHGLRPNKRRASRCCCSSSPAPARKSHAAAASGSHCSLFSLFSSPLPLLLLFFFFFFPFLQYVGTMYPNICKLEKSFTWNAVASCFGFTESANCGKVSFPAIQAAPSFSNSFPALFGGAADVPCLIPCAIDQDPYFRLTRDAASGLGYLKPALIHAKFFPALQGAQSKMSSSDENSAIFVTDQPQQIAHKIKEHALSGGQQLKADQERLGGNCETDVSYQWLTFFELDDAKLAHIKFRYTATPAELAAAGEKRLMSSELKQILVQTLQPIVALHQKMRLRVTDQMVTAFMTPRPLNL